MGEFRACGPRDLGRKVMFMEKIAHQNRGYLEKGVEGERTRWQMESQVLESEASWEDIVICEISETLNLLKDLSAH